MIVPGEETDDNPLGLSPSTQKATSEERVRRGRVGDVQRARGPQRSSALSACVRKNGCETLQRNSPSSVRWSAGSAGAGPLARADRAGWVMILFSRGTRTLTLNKLMVRWSADNEHLLRGIPPSSTAASSSEGLLGVYRSRRLASGRREA